MTVVKRCIIVLVLVAMVLLLGPMTCWADRPLKYFLITFEDDPIELGGTEITVIERKEYYGVGLDATLPKDIDEALIRCKVSLTNKDQPIEAYAIAYAFYDVFDRHLATYSAVSFHELMDSATEYWDIYPPDAWMAYTVFMSGVSPKFKCIFSEMIIE